MLPPQDMVPRKQLHIVWVIVPWMQRYQLYQLYRLVPLIILIGTWALLQDGAF